MIELAAFFYVAGIIVSALAVGAMVAFAAFGYFVWSMVRVAERVRMPRMRLGSWRTAPGFALRLVAMFAVVSAVAVLVA